MTIIAVYTPNGTVMVKKSPDHTPDPKSNLIMLPTPNRDNITKEVDNFKESKSSFVSDTSCFLEIFYSTNGNMTYAGTSSASKSKFQLPSRKRNNKINSFAVVGRMVSL